MTRRETCEVCGFCSRLLVEPHGRGGRCEPLLSGSCHLPGLFGDDLGCHFLDSRELCARWQEVVVFSTAHCVQSRPLTSDRSRPCCRECVQGHACTSCTRSKILLGSGASAGVHRCSSAVALLCAARRFKSQALKCIRQHGFQEIQMFVIRCMIVSEILVLGWLLKRFQSQYLRSSY